MYFLFIVLAVWIDLNMNNLYNLIQLTHSQILLNRYLCMRIINTIMLILLIYRLMRVRLGMYVREVFLRFLILYYFMYMGYIMNNMNSIYS